MTAAEARIELFLYKNPGVTLHMRRDAQNERAITASLSLGGPSLFSFSAPTIGEAMTGLDQIITDGQGGTQ